VLVAFVLGTAGLPASAFAQTGSIQAVASEELPNGVGMASNGVRVRVTALTDTIIRVRVANSNFLEDASWAVPASVRNRSVAVSANSAGFQTKSVAVHVTPATLQLTVTDLQGRTIVADTPEPMRFEGSRFLLRKVLPIDQHIYGMGDKTGAL